MRPIATAGPTVEPLVFPVDVTRAVVPGQTGRFYFSGALSQNVRFQVDAAAGSVVAGTVRVVQGTTVLMTGTLTSGGTVLSLALPAAGSDVLEIEATGQTGSVRLRGTLLGGFQDEMLSFPADVTRSLASYTTYRASFDDAGPTGSHFAYQRTAGTATELRLLGPDGSVLWSKSGAATEVFDLALPAAGRYAFTSSSADGTPSGFRFTSEPIDWLPLGTAAQVGSSFAVLDLVADRNGRPVAGYVRSPVVVLLM